MIIQDRDGNTYTVDVIKRNGNYINGYVVNRYFDLEIVCHLHVSYVWKIEPVQQYNAE